MSGQIQTLATPPPVSVQTLLYNIYLAAGGSQALTPTSSPTFNTDELTAALALKLNANDASVTNARAPTGGAGGVLSGTYPNPGFAVDMATQEELDAVAAAKQPLAAILTALAALANGSGQLTNDGAGALSWEAASGGGNWGDIGGTLSDQADLQAELDSRATLDSPAFTGTPTISGTQIATLANIPNVTFASQAEAEAGTAESVYMSPLRTAQAIAGTSHTHAISDVAGLQTALDGKAGTSHTHSDATTSAAGFMSAADKTKIDAIEAGIIELGPAGTRTTITAGNSGDVTINLPSADGSNGQFLKTDGSGNWAWASPSGSGDVVGPGSSTANRIAVFADTSGTLLAEKTLAQVLTEFGFTGFPVEIALACSDETTALTTGTAKITVRVPYAFTVTGVFASVTTAPVGSTLIVDINEAGTSILSTKLSIDAGEKSSNTASSAAVVSDASIAAYAEITIDIDQIGSSTAGAGLKVWILGVRA